MEHAKNRLNALKKRSSRVMYRRNHDWFQNGLSFIEKVKYLILKIIANNSVNTKFMYISISQVY